MRQFVVGALGAASLVVGAALPAMAAPASKSVTEAVDVACPQLEATDGSAAYLGLSTRPDGGAFATVWRPGGAPDEPWLSGATQDVSFDGTRLRGSIPLVDVEAGTDHGVAVYDVVITPTGEPQTTRTRGGEGNVQSHLRSTITPAAASGTFTVPGVGTFELEGCAVDLVTLVSLVTDPAAYVQNLATHVEISCTFDGASGDVHLYAEGFLPGDRGAVEISIWQVADGSETVELGGSGEAALTRSSLTASVELVDVSGEPAGTAELAAALSVTGRSRTVATGAGVTNTVRSEALHLLGTLSLVDGRTFDLAGCDAVREHGQLRVAPTAPASTDQA
jgi:hypothetical protein